MPVLETWEDLEHEFHRVSRRGARWDWRWQVRYQMTEFGLTPREREVSWLLFEGLMNKEIAARMCIEAETVKNHLTAIYRKANVASREQVILRLLGIGGRDGAHDGMV